MHVRLKPLHAQTIVITGATSGIGLATARAAAEAGASVVLVARNEPELREICEDIRARGGLADHVAADVGSRDELRRVVDTVIQRYGGFDTWVNNAGTSIYAQLWDTPEQDHRQLFETNYWGVVHGSLEALRHLRRHGGALINIGSVLSDMPAALQGAYTASKHAVQGFTSSLRLELIHDGAPVSVTLIKPSGIATPFPEHARNYMDEAARVPPPAYHPRLVADAILHAATIPARELVVGGAGRMMTLFARLLPNLADRVYARALYPASLVSGRPNDSRPGLYRASSEGRELGGHPPIVRETSLYTAVERRPIMSLALTAAALALATGLARRRSRSAAWR